jgi:uncharacterized 2Fe-2S/4Fe-4S cluster protein (DUF4445 family)
MTHRIVFTPSGLGGTVEDGTTVLEAGRALGVDLDSVCGGRGVCGRCQVTPGTGAFAKWAITVEADALGPTTAIETDHRAHRPLVAGNRLGCAATVHGDVVIDVPAASQVHRQVVRKDLDLDPITVDPSYRLYYVEVPEATLGDSGPSTTASGALRSAVAAQHGVARPVIEAHVLAGVQPALAQGRGAATVAVALTAIDRADGGNDGGCIVAVWPGYVDAVHGVAVDVGSTTVAGHLCDLTTGEIIASSGRMNPQIRYGEDLMSRVSYVMMNPGGGRALTQAIRGALDELIGELLEAVDGDRGRVLEVVVVGNPIMHHVILGIDPTPLGTAPFVLATDEAVTGPAGDLELDLPNARYYLGPCIAGHVGADTAAAILAEGPHRGEVMQLLVDVGTNAEIVLGDRTRLLAASSPTGPAFEGAQISCGQRATAGAVERVRIDPTTLEPRFRVIGSPLWSDDPDFAASVTAISGICGSGIIEVIAEMFLAGIIDRDGVIRPELSERTPRVVADGRTFSYVLHDGRGANDGDGDGDGDGDDGSGCGVRLTITQNDVRAIQLAKAALRAGIDLLIEHAGSPDVADIRLAGAFGSHIDPVHAMVIGLVPDCPIEGVRSVGNAAGVGALQALLSRSARAEMERTVRRVEKIETATEARFQQLFVDAMAFPHASAPSTHLAKVVALPLRGPGDEPGRGRSGRRRERTHRPPVPTTDHPTTEHPPTEEAGP